jgi:hypothetical protein
MNALCARTAAGYVKAILVGRGKASMPAPAVPPVRPARGVTCPIKDEAPRMPDGFKTEFDKKGWRH